VELLELVAAAARERPRREHRKFVRTRTRASARRSRLRRAGWRKDAEHVDYKLLVAEADGALAGYVLYGPTPMTEATWDLYWIASDPAFRGKGAGSLLVLAMEDEILRRRGRHVRIETSSLGEYASTRAFYDRHRYLEASRLPDFYKPGDDLVTLYKRLG
jgi:ribosomal protein S18 acetylase RimI-like enzyme